jgi:hypothetical protein
MAVKTRGGTAAPELPGIIEDAIRGILAGSFGAQYGGGGSYGGAVPTTPSTAETPWMTYAIVAAAGVGLYFLLRKR